MTPSDTASEWLRANRYVGHAERRAFQGNLQAWTLWALAFADLLDPLIPLPPAEI